MNFTNHFWRIIMAKVKKPKVEKKVEDKTEEVSTKKPEIVHIDVKEHNKKYLDTMKEYIEPTLDNPKDWRLLGYITLVQIGEDWYKLTKDTIVTTDKGRKIYVLGGKAVDLQTWERQLKLAKLLGK